MKPITEQRWSEAQRAELGWWQGEAERDPVFHAADVADGQHWTRGLLDIRPETVAGKSVLDIAGGPYPVGVDLPLSSYAVLDPLWPSDPSEPFTRLQCPAESYNGPRVDEVWGYNALQHVKEPAAVMATARLHAAKVIRWFDVVNTPLHACHPHSITPAWLRSQFEGFRIVRDIEGSRMVQGGRQQFVAIVAERI